MERSLFEFLDVPVDVLQLRRNRNALRTFAQTLAAADAVVGLTVGRDCPSVARQVGLAEPGIVLLFLVLRECSLVDAFVVVGEYSRNVDSERARHAVLAGRTSKHTSEDVPPVTSAVSQALLPVGAIWIQSAPCSICAVQGPSEMVG